ncbi:hypothetical protein [Spirosoma sp.]|uniref:SGNH/GDSL hydrolase family protein n=1 Tax=Spirosoma sp. TaxID=1899569 RepID=UPI0026199895|nr:hypothetical protein [Spirosoma sp.]MCX6216505.1 hypothetical protein [Spirosoma sp.]
MRKRQDKSALFLAQTITAIGDSQTDLKAGYGVAAYNMWTAQLSKRLNTLGCSTKPRCFGVSGNTTSEMLGRAGLLFLYDTPAIGIIYGGVNDAFVTHSGTATGGTASTITLQNTASGTLGAYLNCTITITSGAGAGQSRTITAYNGAIISGANYVASVDTPWVTLPTSTSVYSIGLPPAAATQAHLQALSKVLKYGVRGDEQGRFVHVYSQADLPAKGNIGQRYVVLKDSSATGGVQGSLPGQNATIAGNYSASPKQSVWEYRNPQAGELGWSRIAIDGTAPFADGVQKVVIVSTNYQNWSSGGDNYNTSTSTGTQYAQYIPIRSAAKAAALADAVVYCDLYDFQSKLIFGGTFSGLTLSSEAVQGSATFHYIDNNQHHGDYGHDTVARAILQTITAQGWLTSLQS